MLCAHVLHKELDITDVQQDRFHLRPTKSHSGSVVNDPADESSAADRQKETVQQTGILLQLSVRERRETKAFEIRQCLMWVV